MIIKFERRTDRPDADGRCQIHLRAYFDGHRLRLSTSERCTAKEWDADTGKFRKSLGGYQDANDNLKSLAARVEAAYRHLRIAGIEPTPELLRAALAEQKAAKTPAPIPPSPALLPLFDAFVASKQARGMSAATLKTYVTTRGRLQRFATTLGRELTLAQFTETLHEAFLIYLRQRLRVSQNTIWLNTRQLLTFFRWVVKTRKLPLPLDLDVLSEPKYEGDKTHLSAADLAMLERVLLPAGLVATRDVFLFCCWTGLRYADLRDLRPAHLQEWNGAKVLRLTQNKTRNAVSIYLTPPALALLTKYEGKRLALFPVTANQVMNRNLKKIARYAGLTQAVEQVAMTDGRLTKYEVPKWELVTMHTARHTFAVQSLMRGMPLAVLQKVMGHAKITTTMIYAKVVEDFQHHEMRRVWEGAETVSHTADSICEVAPAA
jgi:integrase/recombinase XerD